VTGGSAGSDGEPSSDVPFAFDGPPVPLAPEALSRDAEGRATIRAVRLTALLRLDGQLDEAVYSRTPALSDFFQLEPVARRNGLEFAINPIGGRWDGQITSERQFNADWNPVWDLVRRPLRQRLDDRTGDPVQVAPLPARPRADVGLQPAPREPREERNLVPHPDAASARAAGARLVRF
jgi:hypothetical protein